MNTKTVMVQMEDLKWTSAAMREACALAHERGESVALVLLLPKSHVILSNIDVNRYNFSESECDDLRTYWAIAADFDVAVTTHVFEYENFDEAIVRAADAVNADTVFANVPAALVRTLHNRHVSRLEHNLEAHNHHLRAYEVPCVTQN
jgi:hypothetical protein